MTVSGEIITCEFVFLSAFFRSKHCWIFHDHCSLFFLLPSYPLCVLFLMPLLFSFLFSRLFSRKCSQGCPVDKNLFSKWFYPKAYVVFRDWSSWTTFPCCCPWKKVPGCSLALFQVCQQPVGSQFTKSRIILGKYGRWKRSKYWSWQLVFHVSGPFSFVGKIGTTPEGMASNTTSG